MPPGILEAQSKQRPAKESWDGSPLVDAVSQDIIQNALTKLPVSRIPSPTSASWSGRPNGLLGGLRALILRAEEECKPCPGHVKVP